MSSELLPGMYEATVTTMKLDKSAQKETPCVAVSLDIAGRTFRADCWLSPKAIGMTRTKLRRCGFDPDAQSLSDIAANPNICRGNVVKVELYEEEYRGQIRMKCEITMEKLKAAEIDSLTDALREAKGDHETPFEAPPQAPASVPDQSLYSRSVDKSSDDFDDVPF